MAKRQNYGFQKQQQDLKKQKKREEKLAEKQEKKRLKSEAAQGDPSQARPPEDENA